MRHGYAMAGILLLLLGCPGAPEPAEPVARPAAPAPLDVETEGGLALAEVTVDFAGVPLADAIDFLARAAEVTIRIHPSVFECRSAEKLLVRYRGEEVGVASAIRVICADLGLEIRQRKGYLELRPRRVPDGLRVKVYDLRGLVDEESDVAERAPEGVVHAVCDRIGDSLDGNASVEYREGEVLIVEAPVAIHRDVREVLEEIRARRR